MRYSHQLGVLVVFTILTYGLCVTAEEDHSNGPFERLASALLSKNNHSIDFESFKKLLRVLGERMPVIKDCFTLNKLASVYEPESEIHEEDFASISSALIDMISHGNCTDGDVEEEHAENETLKQQSEEIIRGLRRVNYTEENKTKQCFNAFSLRTHITNKADFSTNVILHLYQGHCILPDIEFFRSQYKAYFQNENGTITSVSFKAFLKKLGIAVEDDSHDHEEHVDHEEEEGHDHEEGEDHDHEEEEGHDHEEEEGHDHEEEEGHDHEEGEDDDQEEEEDHDHQDEEGLDHEEEEGHDHEEEEGHDHGEEEDHDHEEGEGHDHEEEEGHDHEEEEGHDHEEEEGHDHEEEEDHDHEEEGGHDHEEEEGHDQEEEEEDHSRQTRETHDHDHDHDHESEDHQDDHGSSTRCFSSGQFMDMFQIGSGITEKALREMCPAIVQQIASGACISSSEHDHGNELDARYTLAMVYGYGTASVAIISLLALLGIALFPTMSSTSYVFTMQFFIGLGIGTMAGDSLLHIIPQVLGLHDHENHDHSAEGEEEDMTFVWKMSVVLGGIYVFFLFENGLRMWKRLRGTKEIVNVSNGVSNDEKVTSFSSMENAPAYPIETGKSTSSLSSDQDMLSQDNAICYNFTPTLVTVFLGDVLHNFADGLAIGVSFTTSWTTGVGTSLAILCHELPHELGDFAIYLKNGASKWHAIGINFIAACCAFLGLYTGIGLGRNEEARMWLMSAIAGMFLYISLVQVLIEMVREETKKPIVQFLVQNLGLLLGWMLMLLIALYEDAIQQSITA